MFGVSCKHQKPPAHQQGQERLGQLRGCISLGMRDLLGKMASVAFQRKLLLGVEFHPLVEYTLHKEAASTFFVMRL